MAERKDAQSWHERANEAKARAAQTTYELRAELLMLAERCERMAQQAAERARRSQSDR